MRLLKEPRVAAPELTPAGWAAGDPVLLGAARGKVVLLDFFSFADPMGIRALPHLRMLHEQYRESGLLVVGVHVPAYEFERPLEAARQEIWRLGLPYPVALDEGYSVFRAYESHDLPARFVVDAKGFLRAWHHGPEGLAHAERAIRALLREAHPERPLPHIVEPSPGMARPGGLHWLATPEIRFGTRAVGFGPPDSDDPEPKDGDSRDFDGPPELRAQGRAYLRGRWTVRRDHVVCDSDEGEVAVVFEGASVVAVLSAASTEDDGHPGRFLDVTLDGEPPEASAAGADVEEAGGKATLPLERGRLYDLVSAAEFGVHNLQLRVHGRGTAFHLLHFGSSEVPEEA